MPGTLSFGEARISFTTPGRYGMAGFLPVAKDLAGTPHYKKGMKAEFTVR